MIPLKLTLKNFLSYREASLDFRGLHTACICGANGSGKSSLLEAITWALWGQSRTPSDDDVIHTGCDDVRVDFQFIYDHETYRVIRSRQRGKPSALDFQIQSSNGFRTLNGKGIKATQDLIVNALRLDYETFINSAYLRQGRADEFMQRRPNERKQILADLLKLSQYEELAAQAKERAKEYRIKADELEDTQKLLARQLDEKQSLSLEKVTVEQQIKQLQQEQTQEQQVLQQLKLVEHHRQTWQQQLNWELSQAQNIQQECDRLCQEQSELSRQKSQLQALINQEEEITANYNHFLHLQEEEEALSSKFQEYQQALKQQNELEEKILKQTNQLNLEIQKAQTSLENLQEQEREIEQILNQSKEVEAALEKLRQCRQRLKQLDELQHQVAPLLQRRYNLETQIEHAKARLSAKLEQLREEENNLVNQLEQFSAVREEALKIDGQIQDLEKKQTYQQRVKEKGTEKRTKNEQLEENQRRYEKQLEELAKKLEMLVIPDAICPLCEQELDEHHRRHVIEKTQSNREEIREQIWQIKEQITIGERELQKLRDEYSILNEEVAILPSLQQYFGQLEAQLETGAEARSKLNKLRSDIDKIEQSLESGNYAPELRAELEQIKRQLEKLNYDEQTHGLVRGEEKNWRWAEIKQAKIEDANRRQTKINTEKPQLIECLNSLLTEREQLRKNSEIQQQLEELQNQINNLGYDPSYHQNLRSTLRQEQSVTLGYQELLQAKKQYPDLLSKINNLEKRLEIQINQQQTIKRQIENIQVEIANIKDPSLEIEQLEKNIQQRRQKLDELLAKKGSLEQALFQIDKIQAQSEEVSKQLKRFNHQHKVYKELAEAFGKNGIQTLMIENILPQLEAETNQIISRLTGNQLHVQFLTQKAGKSSRAKKSAKLIDTLEILIADARGTRPYETYSGGESFRINFSIRLALARLLAQRSGTALQMLIVDEGFGTQDGEGCERLIAAINAIAPDFACILTVTHMPQFKEAFQHRIEVIKTNQGSKVSLSN